MKKEYLMKVNIVILEHTRLSGKRQIHEPKCQKYNLINISDHENEVMFGMVVS